jgi:uncharacterized damage-inducible protein DinB
MMKTARIAAIILLALSTDSMFGSSRPVRQSLDEWISNAEKHVVDLAEAMPEEKYAFVPTNGKFDGVRTFGEQLKHLAANNYGMSSRIEGKTLSQDQIDEIGPESVKTKAQIVEYVEGSFVALHHAAATLSDAKAAVIPQGQKHDGVWFVVDAVAHSFDHYGQLVEYLRMNDIIPPASR